MIQTKLWFTLAASSFLVIASISDANAQLTGSTVNVTAYYPDSSSVYDNPGDRVVDAGVEYPGSFAIYSPYVEIDITDTQLILNWTYFESSQFTAATFNGFILSVISGPVISGASVNPSSGFSPVSLTVDGSNRLLMNYQDVFIPVSSSSIIDLNLVPEPSTLFLLGIGAISLLGYRKAKSHG